jgi:hypothetical protein
MKLLQAALLVAAGMAAMTGVRFATGGSGVLARAQEAPQTNPATSSQAPTYIPGPAAVTVTNEPTVVARQDGEWTVRLDRPPVLTVAPVQVAAPSFIRSGAKYAFTWTAGAKPDIRTVLAVHTDGWVLVSGVSDQPGATWLNTTRAVMIEEVE